MSAASAERSKAKQREVTLRMGEKEARSFCPLHHDNPHNSSELTITALSTEPLPPRAGIVCANHKHNHIYNTVMQQALF